MGFVDFLAILFVGVEKKILSGNGGGAIFLNISALFTLHGTLSVYIFIYNVFLFIFSSFSVFTSNKYNNFRLMAPLEAVTTGF